ncbi:hypothetical protein GG804_17940 [Sphingomonas histidinilytica]|jgi:hypothetical protein|uniref:Uncharacterized protein n=1 Tax=Rhizorhabdus histidinilytica TaxID=439228 RepID=A0A1T5GGH0_9SPHN|nr:hypothetical protein [Rhizorhabdus histidinilytica]MBO9378654.1 hypothetical protein [Rhizorhabdus histidinilytica]QEH77731.1 hypothetical protein EIK56_05990 [Sphingomonas sp. C8-2]SKC07524.1 hypothetical protein SAMN06295920_11496 [Rhizorhabdus histidinilytica]
MPAGKDAPDRSYNGEDASRAPEAGPPINRTGLSAEANRGRRAPQEGSGVVVGSGASAGGGGGDEDFDSDPQGGGGSAPIGRPVPPKER